MNPGSQVNHPIRGSLWRWRSSHSTVKSGSGRQLAPATRGGNRCETTRTNPTRTGPAEESPTPLPIRRFTLRSSGQRFGRGCASWPGSSPAPTCGGRRNGAAHQRQVRRRQVNPASNPPATGAPLMRPRCAVIPFALPICSAVPPNAHPAKGRPPAPAIPRNCLKCNASQGITCKQFLLDNGLFGHCHGRMENDNNRGRDTDPGRG